MAVPFCSISAAALSHNLDLICALAERRRVGIVVKGDAYGHSALLVAKLFDTDPRVDYFLTAGLVEAAELRAAGITKPIMAMAYCDGDFESALTQNIEPSIATYEELVACAAAAERLGRSVDVHIKVDTGIARRGVDWQGVGEFYAQCARYRLLNIRSIFTHCADSSPEDPTFMYEQQRRYDYAIAAARARGFAGATHMASSGSLTLIPEYDMVRVGTMLYGSWKNDIQKKRVREKVPTAELIPALTLCAPVLVHTDGLLRIAVGWLHIFWVAPGSVVRYQCGCYGAITQVHADSSEAEKICAHTVGDVAMLCGPYSGIMPIDCALARGTIANEITTRISPWVARNYSSR